MRAVGTAFNRNLKEKGSHEISAKPFFKEESRDLQVDR